MPLSYKWEASENEKILDESVIIFFSRILDILKIYCLKQIKFPTVVNNVSSSVTSDATKGSG